MPLDDDDDDDDVQWFNVAQEYMADRLSVQQ